MVKFKKMLLFLVMILTIFNMQNVKAATKNINVESGNIKDKSGTIVVEDPVLSNNEITSNPYTFTLEGAVSIEPVYTANTYTITADANDGDIETTSGWSGSGTTATKDIDYSSNYGTLPNATRTGYTLAGWNTKSDGSGTNIAPSTSMTTANNHRIYAIWIGK